MNAQMKVDQKEFFKLSFLYTVVAALPPLLNLFVRPLIEGEGKLNATDFSQIEIAETFISLAFIIATFAMNNAISRFYYDHEDNPGNFKRLVSGIFNSILFRGAVILFVAYIGQGYIGKFFSQPELQDFSSYGFIAIAIGISRAINITAFALYRNEKRVRRYIIIAFLLGFLRSIFQIIGVFYFEMSFVGYLYGSAIGGGLVSIIILFYVYRQSGFHLNWKFLKPANIFALPLFEYALVAWGITFADRYFLESNPVILGIYSQALILGRGIEIIIQGMQGASQPEIFRLMKGGIEKNSGEIKKLSNILMAQSQLLIATAIIPAMLYCLLFKTELKLAAGLIAIVFIRFTLRTQYSIFAWPVFFKKRTSNFLYLNLFILIVNLTLLYFLIPVWGVYGAITAFLTSQTLQVIGIYYIQKRMVTIDWNLNKTLIYPLIIVGLTVFTEIIKVKAGLADFPMAIVVVILIYGSLFLLYKNEIRGLSQKVILNIRSKF